MNSGSKSWMLFTAPITLILALVVAIPLVFSDDCDPALASSTGPTSDAISIMSWNLCVSSCGGFDKRVGPAMKQVAGMGPDIVSVQEGGWGPKKRVYTFGGFKSIGYASANQKKPYIGRYNFYKPSKFTLLSSGSFSLGGNHGVAWAKFRTKADKAEFVVANTHLAPGQSASADSSRRSQMATALPRIAKIAGGLLTVWAGDFNSNKSRATDAPAQAFKAAGMTDTVKIATQKANQDVNSAKGRSGTDKIKKDGNQTDHIYVTGGVSVSRWSQTVVAKDGHYVKPFISDHNSIMATVGIPGAQPSPEPSADSSADTAAPALDASSGVGRWKGEQIKNAAAIVAAGKKMGINQRGQTIAVMTAMAESSLTVLNRGDAAGPDSRGLFQQRDSWGTLAERMDPATSATLFYRALQRVDGWAELEPTVAAHRVQRNADPNVYAKFWEDAVQVVASVTGQSAGVADAAVAPGCTDDTTDAVWASGADCDFGNISTPRSCAEALNEAARISRDSACSNEVRGGTWRRRCLEFVARVYGYASSGTPTAKAQYRLMKSKGLISTDKNIPAGALVYFNSSDPAGHIAVYAGDGKAFSNDYVRPGCIDLTPMTSMGGNGQYLGWSPPVFPLGAPL